jgi:hypothetical protein
MEVIVESPKVVIVNGINCGNVVDAIANMPQFAPNIQLALELAWEREIALTKADTTLDTKPAANLGE